MVSAAVIPRQVGQLSNNLSIGLASPRPSSSGAGADSKHDYFGPQSHNHDASLAASLQLPLSCCLQVAHERQSPFPLTPAHSASTSPLPNTNPRPATAPGPHRAQQNPRPSGPSGRPLLAPSPTSETSPAPAAPASPISPLSPAPRDLLVHKRPQPIPLTWSHTPPASSSALENCLSPTRPNAPLPSSRSSSRSDRRSPSIRRPPASFSSNGIETSFGPPSSLITRSPYHSDLARLAQNPAASTFALQQQKPYNTAPNPRTPSRSQSLANPHPQSPASTQSTPQAHDSWTSTILSSDITSRKPIDSLDAIVGLRDISQPKPLALAPDQSPTSPNKTEMSFRDVDEGIESSQSSDDLFLKMANDSAEQQAVSHVTSQFDYLQMRPAPTPPETRDSPITIESTLPATRRRNSSPSEHINTDRQTSLVRDTSAGYRRSSGSASVVGIPSRTPSMVSHDQRLAAYRARHYANQSPSVVPKVSDATSLSQRRLSTDHVNNRQFGHRFSKLNPSSPLASDSSPVMESQHYLQDHRHEGDSVVSASHSTVWDEMHDVRSRPHRSDHSRPFHSAGASNGSGERPRTATTTVTTVSSSPRISLGFRSGEGKLSNPSNVHPLLLQSLARCKPVLSAPLYRSLENAAFDALEMASWSRSGHSYSSAHSSVTSTGMTGERQLRRKADNICRNLTELCVTLADQGQVDAPARHTADAHEPHLDNRDSPLALFKGSAEPNRRSFTRQASLEPDDHRPASSRALERVEARRVSLMATSTPSGSPRDSHHHHSQRLGQQEQQKLSTAVGQGLRSGTSMLRTRRAVQDDEDESPSHRAPSRAVTEVGQMLRKRTDRISSGLGIIRRSESQSSSQQPSATNPVRKFTGNTGLSPISSSTSVLRGTGRYFGSDRLPAPDSSDDDKRTKRRSFGLYNATPSPITSRLRPASLSAKRASLTSGD